MTTTAYCAICNADREFFNAPYKVYATIRCVRVETTVTGLQCPFCGEFRDSPEDDPLEALNSIRDEMDKATV